MNGKGWRDNAPTNGDRIHAVIGRFQMPHLGHQHLIDQALVNADTLIIFLGSANHAITFKNPFTDFERQLMVEQYVRSKNKDVRLEIRNVPDFIDDVDWANYIKREVASIKTDNDWVVLYGFEKDASSYYLKYFPEFMNHAVESFHAENDEVLGATEIREMIYNGVDAWKTYVNPFIQERIEAWMKTPAFKEVKEQYDFTMKYRKQFAPVSDGENKYDINFVTVDTVVFVGGEVVVVKRKEYPGTGLFALPGGFLLKGKTLRRSADIHFEKKTGIDIAGEEPDAFFVVDNPDRSLRGRTITNVFVYNLDVKKYYDLLKNNKNIMLKTAATFAITDINKFFEDHFQIIVKADRMIR